ncbi:hypothetical protein [Terrisporobacter mayombei]|uniref:hypothetical protein n=1 Tax=Terrisporobacter mayombei TaxID=1541 RepID=UPI00265A0497|nr:hypothetical protein [Terrisporobacter mayombei]MCC3668625.1 hypothetical protein [Terrisporobacter mayombei]
MIKSKNLYMANFNCTFGDEHYPMLDYFEEIVLPAFINKYKKETSKNTFFFHNVKLVEYSKGQFALTGIIVKQTILEVKSLIDEETQSIIKKDDKIPSDPFSYFILFLDTHRMVLVKNQSGSPTLKNFESLSKYTLREASIEFAQDGDIIPISLNIGSLPSSSKVDEALAKILEIQEITLKIYPLNGDIDNVYGSVRTELERMGAAEGFTTFKRPQNRQEVSRALKESKGIFRTKIRGKGLKGEKITIDNDEVASVTPIEINEDVSIEENINNMLEEIQSKEELRELSEENRNKYEEKKTVLRRILALFNSNTTM